MDRLTRSERKSLAYHRRVAELLREGPERRAQALARLAWLRSRNPAGMLYYDTWQCLLEGPLESLIEAMLDPSERGCSLRQENPFVDLVSQRERAAIHRQVTASLDRVPPP